MVKITSPVAPQDWIASLRNKKYIKAIYNARTNNVDIYYSICGHTTKILKESLTQNQLDARISYNKEAYYHVNRYEDCMIAINKSTGVWYSYSIRNGARLKHEVVNVANAIIDKHDSNKQLFDDEHAYEAYEYLTITQPYYEIHFLVNHNPIK